MGRSPCCDENNLKKGPWTPEEDQKLTDYIQKNGHGSWRALPKLAGLKRCGKSCRLRWTNYLRPDIKRGKFSEEEENTILHFHSILGNKWSTIAAHLPGRTDNEIKNYWNTHLKKRLIQMGIDPMTHQPKTDLFSCLPQLIALANLKELLEHTQLTHNLQYLNLLRQHPGFIASNPQFSTNLMPANNEELNLYNFSKELGQEERVEMSNFFPVENTTSVGGSQPLQEQITFMNNIIMQTNDQDREVGDHCQVGFMSDKSSSSTWNPLPSLVDTNSASNNNTNSQEHSSTVSYGGGAGGGCGGGPAGVSSLKEWQDFLFEDSFLDENLKEIC